MRRASILTSEWGFGGAAVLALFFWFAGPAIINILTTAPDVRAAARIYLPWLAIAPLIGIASWMLDGIFIGATLTREMRVAMFQAVAIYVAALLILPHFWGNHGLWAALMVLNMARALTMGRLFPRALQVAHSSV